MSFKNNVLYSCKLFEIDPVVFFESQFMFAFCIEMFCINCLFMLTSEITLSYSE